MNKPASCVVLLSLAAALASAQTPNSQIAAAEGVLHRLIGKRADAIRFELEPADNGLDTYDYSADHGIVTVRGNDGVSLCRGAYDYLKDKCGCLVTWDGDQLHLPATFPDSPKVHDVTHAKYRHYFNVCTFGYTTVFWNWKRWQREIDWMALHGINAPLAMNGEEKVWEDVFATYGISNAEMRAFFGGPAFLPWHRMGNVDSLSGPLPQSYIDEDARLQTRILGEERGLGMTPITPGFSGFIPKAFAEANPKADVLRSSGWGGFAPTYQLDARDPLFADLQSKLVKAYQARFGSGNHMYLVDLYNEMDPQATGPTQLKDLDQIGHSIINSLTTADPDAKWVMQGWLFYNDQGYWKKPQTSAFLDAVPQDRMVLLDLDAPEFEVWRAQPAFRNKPYIWNLLHNFGGRTRMYGDLADVQKKFLAAYNSTDHGQLSGYGLTMEGTMQNSVEYEFMLDLMWHEQGYSLPDWTSAYGVQRYHSPLGATIWPQIWKLAYQGGASSWDLNAYQARPSTSYVKSAPALSPQYRSLIEEMIQDAPTLKSNPLFIRDFVDVAKHYFADAIADAISTEGKAVEAKDAVAAKSNLVRLHMLMDQLNEFINSVPDYRMSAWIHHAASIVPSKDKPLLVENARQQITVWGGPEIYDYAAKEWSGLINNFYEPRWDRFFKALAQPGYTDDKFFQDSATWELDWCKQTKWIHTRKKDPITLAQTMLNEISQP